MRYSSIVFYQLFLHRHDLIWHMAKLVDWSRGALGGVDKKEIVIARSVSSVAIQLDSQNYYLYIAHGLYSYK